MRLTCRGRDVFKVGVVVKDHCTVVLRHGGGQQIEHAGSPVVPTGGHPKLDIAGPLRDRFADRQNDVELSAALSDRAHVGKVTAGVTGLQINGHAGGCGPIDDESGDDVSDRGMLDPSVGRGVDQV